MSVTQRYQPFETGETLEVDQASDLAARPPTGSFQSPAAVRWLQAALNIVLSASLVVDGVAGSQTRAAVSRFQTRRGLTVDGIAGPQTFGALVQALDALASGGGASVGGPACAILNEPEVFDDFDFDQATLKPEHHEQLAVIAACLSSSPALRRVRIVGHTDPEGSAQYNEGLGRRRAEATKAALQTALAEARPDVERQVAIDTDTRGELEPISAIPARNRRVQVFLNRRVVAPLETGRCSGSDGPPGPELAAMLEMEVAAATATPTRPVIVRPRLSFFQNARETIDRNHFINGARTQAQRMQTIASPTTAECRRVVGPTSYDTGADIISAIEAAHACLDQRVAAVHIFSHSGPGGVFGRSTGTAGLYQASATYVERSAGGRNVTDIPTTALADDVVFVLHGCNNAMGTDNVARSLYDHLAASPLTNPRVYGHHNTGCASRNNSWREYSNAHPMGRRLAVIPVYASMPWCKKP